jgi:hypothetical protein
MCPVSGVMKSAILIYKAIYEQIIYKYKAIRSLFRQNSSRCSKKRQNWNPDVHKNQLLNQLLADFSSIEASRKNQPMKISTKKARKRPTKLSLRVSKTSIEVAIVRYCKKNSGES